MARKTAVRNHSKMEERIIATVSPKNIIIQEAKKIGFSELGFAKYRTLFHEIQHYNKWINSGFNADLNWMKKNIDKRLDPALIVDNPKTIVVTAFNYNSDYYHSAEPNKGKISRYAWGDDYHDILLPKLRTLESKIKEIYPNSNSRSYVDTGPVLERQWARIAGIGWQGKNSLIINRSYGSWLFLGVIITSAEFLPDKPINDFCGTCTKCIDACPTGAIVAPKVVDSNKCISYWTIESRGTTDFPEEVKKGLNNYIFGCDICQEVCPWNRKKVFTDDVKFYPRNDETELDIEYIKGMTQEEFSARFKKSPIKRAKIGGLKKNIENIIK